MMQIATLKLETLACPFCLQKIEAGIKTLNGIDPDDVKVMFNASRVKVRFDDQKTSLKEIENMIESLGYQVLKSSAKSE